MINLQVENIDDVTIIENNILVDETLLIICSQILTTGLIKKEC